MVKVDIKKLPKETQQKLNELMPRVESKEIILEQLKKKHPKRYGTNPGLYEKLAEEENARQERILQNSAKTARTPETMQELEQILKAEGELWRDEHAKINDNTGEIKAPQVPARIIADILEKHLNLTLVGGSSKEIDKAIPYFYDLDEGIYISLARPLEKLCLAVERRANSKERREAIEYVRLEAPRNELTTDKTKIVCNNGIYNTKTRQLEPFSPKYFFTAKIKTNYNPDAKEPVINGWSVRGWLQEIAGDDETKLKLLWQLIASTINSNYLQPYAFFLIDDGRGRTGKGTFQEFLMALVGPGNYASLKLIEFENDFKLAQAIGTALIIGDDNNPNEFHEDNSKFKSMVTGDIVLINPKGLPPYTAKSHALIVQSMNGRPKLLDTTGGNLRRFKIIKFLHQYEDTPEGRRVKDDYIKRREVLEWTLKEAVKVDIENLVDTSESVSEVEKIRTENDPIAYFIENYFTELKSARIPIAFLFKFFQATQKYETGRTGTTTQRGFTRKLTKCLPAGWGYDRKNMYVGDCWNNEDLETLKKYSSPIAYEYKRTEKRSKDYQPIIYKI